MSEAEDKQSLREEVWSALEEQNQSLFPGARGRIPNFRGRDEAARRLCERDCFQSASALKINPDSPQTPVRERALRAGKTLYMAVPRLKRADCFLELDPATLRASPGETSTLKGASEHGRPIHPSEMDRVDLIVTGAVAVDRRGARLGKGGGYSDLEYAILNHFDRVEPDVTIASTVHPLQELEPGRIPREAQDISLNLYGRPDSLVSVEDPPSREGRLDFERLSEEKIASIPILQELRP